MPGRIIPTDFTPSDGDCLFVLSVPNSPGWRALAAGLVLELSHWWTWDAESGDLDEALLLAFDMFEALLIDCDAQLVDLDGGSSTAVASHTIDGNNSFYSPSLGFDGGLS